VQKWEYLFVSVEAFGDFKVVWWRQGSEVGQRKPHPTLFEFAEELGEQGWELVAAPMTKDWTSDSYFKLIFKRPKA
jgi:hypothetical protein